MARSVLAPVAPTIDGAAISYTAPTAEGDAVQPGTALLVKNGSAGAITVTLVTDAVINGLAIADKTLSVGAGADVLVAVPRDTIYQETSAGATRGLVQVDYSAVTSITRASIANA
jgi:hypothetical protein